MSKHVNATELSYSYLHITADGKENQLLRRACKHQWSLTNGLDDESHKSRPHNLTTLKNTALSLSSLDSLRPGRASTTPSFEKMQKATRFYVALGTKAAATTLYN